MKRCPECRRDYYDETLLYCLDDGTPLLDGPASGSDLATAIISDPDPVAVPTRHLPAGTDGGQTDPATALITSQGRARALYAVLGIFALAFIAAGAFLVYRFLPTPTPPPRSIKLEKVTTDGKTFTAAISPDGKYAVYNVDAGGAQSLWTRQIATSSPVQIVAPTQGVVYWNIRFSPGGDFVTFTKREAATTLSNLYQMPVLGGPQKKLANNVDGGATYSPDGRQMTFLRGNYPEMGDSSIIVANADGSNERILAKRTRPETFPWWPLGTAAWSPDGKVIATVIGGDASGGAPMQVAAVSVSDGSVKPIANDGWYEIAEVAWLPDQSGLLVIGAEKASDFYSQQIYLVPYPSGEKRRITSDFYQYIGLSLTADGRSMAALQSSRLSGIWFVPNADAARAEQVKATGSNHDGIDGLSAAPDGRLVFYSKAGGGDDIWIMNPDGTDLKQLTVDGGTNYDLRITPDGRYVVFTSERSGQPNIWRMNIDGSDPRQLTSGSSEYGAAVTPDSKWVYFDSTLSGTPTLWKVSIDGGEPVQITKRFTENAEISPDGKYIVGRFRENSTASWLYAIFLIDGGDPIKVLNLPLLISSDVRWAPDGRAINYIATTNGVSNIWSHPIDGGSDKQITNFKTDRIYNFKWTPDGKSLIVARGSDMSDIVMIKDFR